MTSRIQTKCNDFSEQIYTKWFKNSKRVVINKVTHIYSYVLAMFMMFNQGHLGSQVTI